MDAFVEEKVGLALERLALARLDHATVADVEPLRLRVASHIHTCLCVARAARCCDVSARRFKLLQQVLGGDGRDVSALQELTHV